MNGFISFPLIRRLDDCLSYRSRTSAGRALILNNPWVLMGDIDLLSCPHDISTISFWNSGVSATFSEVFLSGVFGMGGVS